MIRAVFTIARRDITATIFSRGFLIWLAMPVIGLIFGVLASLASDREPAPATSVAIIDPAGGYAPWLQTTAARERTRNEYDRLRSRWASIHADKPYPAVLARPSSLLADSALDALGHDGAIEAIKTESRLDLGSLDKSLGRIANGPAFTLITPESNRAAQIERLLKSDKRHAAGRFGAVLAVDGDTLRLVTRGKGSDNDRVRYLAGLAWTKRALAAEGLAPALDRVRTAQPDISIEQMAVAPQVAERKGSALATGATTVLFALISLLAGALLSNMVEEKANKVIEVLVASVPIPAIYAGKLVAMLAVSLIGVTVWGIMFGGGAMLAVAQLPAGFIPSPARGWPELLALGLAYFICAYLIYGAIYLGIGSLCSSIREVQTLSMPVTIVQMVVLIVTLGALGNPDGTWSRFVSWFPLSAPYMMAGRASLGTGLGVHAAAIAWQLVFAAFVIFVSARLFRYGVLHSGPPPSLRQLGARLFARKAAA